MSNLRHGLSKTKLYHVWDSMIQRCTNPNSDGYRKYGAKGIRVCTDWLDARKFMAWALLKGYCEGMTIERVNAYGDYCPTNCTWIAPEDQFVNRRIQANNSSGYVGVTYHKGTRKWASRVTHKGRRKQLGRYNTPELANQARLDFFKKHNMTEQLKAYDLQQQNSQHS